MNYNHSIDITIEPPGSWHNDYRIFSRGPLGTRETPVPVEAVKRLMDKLYGVEPEIMENRIVIHGYIKTLGQR